MNRPNSALFLSSNRGYSTFPSGIYFFQSVFTITLWISLNSVTTNARIFEISNGWNMDSVTLSVSRGNIATPVFTFTNQNNVELVSNITLRDHNWFFIAVTMQGRVARMYINGHIASEVTFPVAVPSVVRNSNIIGRGPNGPSRITFNELKIFNTALNLHEIIMAMRSIYELI
jgi:hypothetical protein